MKNELHNHLMSSSITLEEINFEQSYVLTELAYNNFKSDRAFNRLSNLSKKRNKIKKINQKTINDGESIKNYEIFKRSFSELKNLVYKESVSKKKNKKIWFFWDQDIENAPEVVSYSLQSWKKLNPDYQVVILNNSNINDYLGFDFNALFYGASVDLRIAGKTDLMRLLLCYKHGGIWVDATTLCLEPLKKWLDSNLNEDDIFCFRQPQTCRDGQLVSWFLASSSGNAIIKQVLDLALTYLFKEREISLRLIWDIKSHIPDISRTETGLVELKCLEKEFKYPHFWMFYLFNDVVNHTENKKKWEEVNNKINFYCQPHATGKQLNTAYVSKMTYKENYHKSESFKSRKKLFQDKLKKESNPPSTPLSFKQNFTLHLGVHKTGTTYLQKKIYDNITHLNNLEFYSTRELRPDFIKSIQSHLSFTKSKTPFLFEKENIIISDENILGNANKLRKGELYNDLSLRIDNLIKIIPKNSNVIVYITIRNYNDFISSMYFEFLRHSKYIPFEKYTENLHKDSICWVKLAEIIKTKFGESNVIINKYECTNIDSLTNKIIGENTKIKPTLYKNKHILRSSLSTRKNSILNDLYKIYGQELTTKIFREMEKSIDENDTSEKCRFTFKDSLNEKYEQDCLKLGA